MDGKQARKLGCGTPLGLSLDHGCDAVSSVLVPAIGCAYLQLGQSISTVIFIVIAPIAAFFITWEEFYTGTFHLGVFNGVDEGGLITDLTFFSAGIMGPEMLTDLNNFFVIPEYGYRVKDIWVAGMVFAGMTAIVPAIVKVVRIEKWKKAMFTEFSDNLDGGNTTGDESDVSRSPTGSVPWSARHYRGRRPRVRDAFNATLPVIFGSGLWICSVYFPFKQSGILLEHTRTVIWLGVMLFSKLITHLHIAHVCGDPYYQWRKTYLIPVTLITLNALYSDLTLTGQPIVDEIGLLIFCSIFATLSWMHMCFSVVTGMCKALDIPFLVVPEKCLKDAERRLRKVGENKIK